MFEYQNNKAFFAQTQRGLEELAARELEELGARDCRPAYLGVYFRAKQEALYRINYCSRLVSRVLAPLVSFRCPSDQVLYKEASAFDWSQLFSISKSFAVFASVSNSRITHSQFAGRRLKDAIVDQFRTKYGRRPNVNPKDPDIWINLNIRENKAVISMDTSGGPLHKRGYRQINMSAPLRETLAAAIVRLSEWDGSRPLVDPMCGSGTILAEAVMAYRKIPAAFNRTKFGFYHLPDYDDRAWEKVKRDCEAQIRRLPEGLISGSDKDPDAVNAARQNLAAIPGGDEISIKVRPFEKIKEIKNSTIITNPPYGVRIGEKENAEVLVQQFGDFLKHHCTGSSAFLVCGDTNIVKSIGLRSSRRFILYNGPLEIRLVKLDLY
jgi:putative N6-adenine-specific DNA methylase